MAERFGFRFELEPIDHIQPWGEPGEKHLHWFGLTSGQYWIETPLGEVLGYTPEMQKLCNLPFPHVDYQVARLFEDLQELWPGALEEVPPDIAAILNMPAWLDQLRSWLEPECGEDEQQRRWNLYEAALSWRWHRTLDTAYLRHGPTISIWRVVDDIHLLWRTKRNEDRGVPVYVVPNGEFVLNYRMFTAAAFDFCDQLLAAMHDRIDSIRLAGWNRLDCTLELDALVAEQQHREEKLTRVKRQLPLQTDWPGVRLRLQTLLLEVPSPLDD